MYFLKINLINREVLHIKNAYRRSLYTLFACIAHLQSITLQSSRTKYKIIITFTTWCLVTLGRVRNKIEYLRRKLFKFKVIALATIKIVFHFVLIVFQQKYIFLIVIQLYKYSLCKSIGKIIKKDC